jgi:hypothetical protein
MFLVFLARLFGIDYIDSSSIAHTWVHGEQPFANPKERTRYAKKRTMFGKDR